MLTNLELVKEIKVLYPCEHGPYNPEHVTGELTGEWSTQLQA